MSESESDKSIIVPLEPLKGPDVPPISDYDDESTTSSDESIKKSITPMGQSTSLSFRATPGVLSPASRDIELGVSGSGTASALSPQTSAGSRKHPESQPSIASATVQSRTKSLFSIHTMVETDEMPLDEEILFDQVWGISPAWVFGRYIRDLARSVHKEHWNKAVESQGGLPKGTRLRLPSVLGADMDANQQPGTVSTASVATTLSSNKPSVRSADLQRQGQAAADICSPDTKKEILGEIREDINEEEFLFKEIHPHFTGNYSVLIWSPFDSIVPKVRLTAPFELVCMSFCPHNGNFLVGGSTTGLVILWDITGKVEDKSENVYYSTDPSYLESQRVISHLLKWRRSKRTFKQIYPTAITAKNDSHHEKIIDIQWIHGDKEWDCKSGKIIPRTDPKKQTLQFITVSEDRVMKVWDMKSEPRPAQCLRYPDKGFTKTSAAKKPSNLEQAKSKYGELNRRWVSIYTVEPKHDDNTFFFSTTAIATNYYQKPPSYNKEIEKPLEGFFFGTLNGHVGYFTWECTPFESATLGSLDVMDTQVFKSYHDGPVNCIARHPLFEHVCLSTGGHVFAIWNLYYPSEPIKWVRYKDVMVTACSWSEVRYSVFKIARSDGLLEFWDLLFYSHRPRVDPLCTGNGITMMSELIIPPKQFIAITDITSSLRLYQTTGHNRRLNDDEQERLAEMLNSEPDRKSKLQEWATKWLSQHVIRDRQGMLSENEEVLNTQTVQARTKEPHQQTSCEPYMAQLYKWYLRRRGDKSSWLDEADKKWYEQELSNMKTQILANKMWDQKKMDVVMKQLDVKEKREFARKQRVQEILDQADEIFKAAVADIFIKKEIELKASKISVKVDEPKEFDIQSAIQETHLLFGENSRKFEAEKLADVAQFPVKERKMLLVLAKYRQVRMVFNDLRRNRDSKLKWLRNKLRKEVEKYGCELIEWHTRTNSLMKWQKYERRIKDIDELRDLYGLFYNPLWDKDRRVSKFEKRMAIGNIRVRYPLPPKKKKKKGLDLDAIMEGGEIALMKPIEGVEMKSPSQMKTDKSTISLKNKYFSDLKEVEQETVTPLNLETPGEPEFQSFQETVEQISSLPDIKKSVSFMEPVQPGEEETTSGGVLPLPDIIPRAEQSPETSEIIGITESDERPYLESLLAQTVEFEETSDSEDFEPDITVMEQHRDVDVIVDKLSSVYAMLKADVNIKAELHKFKWETTEEYLVSDDEDKKSEQLDDQQQEEEETIEQQAVSAPPQHDDVSDEYLGEMEEEYID